MTKPTISEMKKVLTKHDWHWSPYFEFTPVKKEDVKREIINFKVV